MPNATRTIFVRSGGDWGEFFVNEREPRQTETGHTVYAVTWTCYSSYGVYGHHWSNMGQPFAEYARAINDDYLLGKIAREVFDDEKFKRWMNREIFTARTSRENKGDAADSFRRLRMDYSGEALATLCYEDEAISRCQPEWTDASSRSWDPQAVGFVRHIWPKFVEALSPAPAASPADEREGR